MNRVLKRPMFRRGGSADGITSGLDQKPRQEYSRGLSKTKLTKVAETNKANGTKILFCPDKEIFGENVCFSPKILFSIIKNKAYLSPGVKIHWKCNEKIINDESIPTNN